MPNESAEQQQGVSMMKHGPNARVLQSLCSLRPTRWGRSPAASWLRRRVKEAMSAKYRANIDSPGELDPLMAVEYATQTAAGNRTEQGPDTVYSVRKDR